MATQWIQSYPSKTKSSGNAQEVTKVIYTDNSVEFGKACEDLSWKSLYVTPHRSETNVIAERAVCRIKERTSAVLLHSGLDEKWWVDSMECYCYLRNIQDLLSDGTTPYERRFGMPFDGPVVPCGAMVEDHLISAQDLSRHQFGPKSLAKHIPWICCARRGEPGMETLWSQTLENWERWTHPNSMRKDSMQRKSAEKFTFPISDGRVKLSAGDQVLRTSTSIRDRLDREEQGKSSKRIRRIFFNSISRLIVV